jgi:hypothetical protein
MPTLMQQSADGALLALFRVIASRDAPEAAQAIDSSPASAVTAIRIAASRQDAALPRCIERFERDAARQYVPSSKAEHRCG